MRPADSPGTRPAGWGPGATPAPLGHTPPLAADLLPGVRPREIRCLIVDDHPAVRAGLAGLLGLERDVIVLDALASAEEGLSFARRERVDVAVVDYQLGGRSGLWLTRQLRARAEPPAVLIYSAFSDWLLTAACVVAGACGLVSKTALGDELAVAIRRAAAGDRLLPAVAPVLAESIRRRLDAEELSIFGMLVSGVAADEIARTLRIRDADLDATLWEMLRKLERVGGDG